MRPGTSLDLVESFLKTCFFAGLRRLCVGWFLRLDGIRRDPSVSVPVFRSGRAWVLERDA